MILAQKNVAPGPAADRELPSGLAWQEFSAAHFPGSRRHDLGAIAAYAAYRRSLAGKRRTTKAERSDPALHETQHSA